MAINIESETNDDSNPLLVSLRLKLVGIPTSHHICSPHPRCLGDRKLESIFSLRHSMVEPNVGEPVNSGSRLSPTSFVTSSLRSSFPRPPQFC